MARSSPSEKHHAHLDSTASVRNVNIESTTGVQNSSDSLMNSENCVRPDSNLSQLQVPKNYKTPNMLHILLIISFSFNFILLFVITFYFTRNKRQEFDIGCFV